MRILFVGRKGGTHIAGCFEEAAKSTLHDVRLCDTAQASDAPRWLTALNWHLRGHRPPRLRRFSRQVVEQVRGDPPDVLLSTGLAPLTAAGLREIGQMGVRRVNFSTDDPWNPNHRASWFFDALPHYDTVFTPRRANMEQFREVGCRTAYLPFGYDPDLFYPESLTDEEHERLACDVLFVGGADDDRVPIITALIEAGFDVALYGGYWDRYPETRHHSRRQASPATIRKATRAAKVALCLVRRANRDGHVMRSFEIPSTGACMLAEDTDEHRALFGPEDEAVRYFDSIGALKEKMRDLLADDEERERLACAAHERITQGEHTYRDRLETMLHHATETLT